MFARGLIGVVFAYGFAFGEAHARVGESALVEERSLRVTVKSISEARVEVRYVVTILTAAGRDHGIVNIFYDELSKLSKISGEIRDHMGRVVRRLGRDDQIDRSAIDSGTLYDDNRMRTVSLVHSEFPYTVAYEYAIDIGGLSWPTWYPNHPELNTLRTSFEIVTPQSMGIRYYSQNLDLQPRHSTTGNVETYRWELIGAAPFEREPYGPNWERQAPAVFVVPSVFEVEGFGGNMSSWDSFGQWYRSLSVGRARLSGETVSKLQELVANTNTQREAVRVVYRHLQRKTRYVSVQLGIGSWRPEEASLVEKRGYGDCKALSNYMLAMLKAVGIDAYPALIRRGYGAPNVITDFPCNQFNHVVLHVPSADSLWLECTSQDIPFGFLGADNEDRYALVVREDGSELLRTPSTTSEDNFRLRRGTFELSSVGAGSGSVEEEYTGNQAVAVIEKLGSLSEHDRVQRVRSGVAGVDAKVGSVHFQRMDADHGDARLRYTMSARRMATKAGTRLFLRPFLLDEPPAVPPELETRSQPVILPFAFTDVDTLDFELPQGYKVEVLPAPVGVEFDFGRYHADVAFPEEGRLQLRRRFEMNRSELLPDEYDSYRELLAAVAEGDGMQVVLRHR